MLKDSKYVKIRTAVPVLDAEKVRQAMVDAGAGVQGNYSHCSGSYLSMGRFIPLTGANPTIGVIGKPEEVQEEIIEMPCLVDKLEAVISALKQVHPYEEPAIDLIRLLDLK